MKSPSRRRSLFCSLLILLFAGQIVQAQRDTARQRFLTIGLGSSFNRLQDPAVSPMVYTGSPFALSFGFEKLKPSSLSLLSLSGDVGALSAANATDLRPMASTFYRIDLAYAYLRQLPAWSAGRFQWWLGGRYSWHNTIRLTPQNDSGFISFFIANSIGISAATSTTVNWLGKPLGFRWSGDVALISHIIRPSYLNLYNFLDPKHDWLSERLRDSRWVTLNKFPNIHSRLELNYPIAGGNQLQLAYQWAFYHYQETRRVNAARHSFLFSLLIRI